MIWCRMRSEEELADASDEQSTNAPSEDGNIVYMNLTATVEGEEAADPGRDFYHFGTGRIWCRI